ncbi:MAG: hypothetical protein IH931_01620 [candidate division Zixibacteria bacterium]|nr:hypothetical protein [candidate division Zixibacteria bacterium]
MLIVIIKIMRSTLLIILAAAMTSTCLRAEAEIDTVASITGIEIVTAVDRAEMYVGDLINYTITIEHDSAIELLPPPLGANLGAFDVKDYETDITTKLRGGRIKSENRFVLSTFTTGNYLIPPVPMVFEFPDGTRKVILSESVLIKVQSLLLNTDDSLDIKPLKSQYEFERDYTRYFIWGALAFLILALAGYLLWRKLRGKGEAEFIDLRPAWEIAFEKLAILEQKKLIDEEKFKEFYLELTDILRAYLGRMYARNIVDMTTEEFFSIYARIGLPTDAEQELKEFFDHADLVKFAKYIPRAERPKTDFAYTHDFIELIRREFQKESEQELNNTPDNQQPASVNAEEGSL